MKLNHQELLDVLELFEFDNCDELFWRTDGDYAPITIMVMCNDFFHWGTGDVEEITPQNLAILRQACDDVRAATGNRYENGGLLFCARVRNMRPQGACYKYIPEALRPLYDAAGPERETGLGNPYQPLENA